MHQFSKAKALGRWMLPLLVLVLGAIVSRTSLVAQKAPEVVSAPAAATPAPAANAAATPDPGYPPAEFPGYKERIIRERDRQWWAFKKPVAQYAARRRRCALDEESG